MTQCKKIPRKHRQVCIGALNTPIELNNRDIQAPELGGVDFDEAFAATTTVFSLVETKTGVTIFDQSNIERVITHFFYIRFDSTVTQETWIRFDGNFFDIHNVENLDSRSEFLLLRAGLRGPDTIKTNFS